MTEQSPEQRDEALKRAREIYERLVREQRWDFHNVPSASAPPPRAGRTQEPGDAS